MKGWSSTLWGSVVASLEVTRPHNGVLVACAVIGGSRASASESLAPATLLLAALACGLVTAGSSVVNDIVDEDLDSRTRPLRPLPSGRLTRRAAWRVYVIVNGLALGSAALAGWKSLAVVLAWMYLMYVYTCTFKRRTPLSSILVAGVAGSAFWVGGWLGSDATSTLVISMVAFLFVIGREILKDVETYSVDLDAGVPTIAGALGEDSARVVGAIACGLALAVGTWQSLLGSRGLGPPFHWYVVLPLGATAVSLALMGHENRRKVTLATQLLKCVMIAWTIQVAIG